MSKSRLYYVRRVCPVTQSSRVVYLSLDYIHSVLYYRTHCEQGKKQQNIKAIKLFWLKVENFGQTCFTRYRQIQTRLDFNLLLGSQVQDC